MRAEYPAGSQNVGDELNGWLWPSLLSDIAGEGVALLGIGTLLNRQFCARLRDARKILVVGTGAGYGELPALDERWHFYAVRGPRTAASLGLPSSVAVADAAYLLATLDWGRMSKCRAGIAVVPHHRSLRLIDWESICKQVGFTFISPLLPAEIFMQKLGEAELVLAEAMHGAILADILRVPWSAFSFGKQFNLDKWEDWGGAFDLSVGVTELPGFYDPSLYGADRSVVYHLGNSVKAHMSRYGVGKRKWRTVTPPGIPVATRRLQLTDTLVRLAREGGQLSMDSIFATRVAQLYARLNDLRKDMGAPPRGPLVGDPRDFFHSYGAGQ